MLLQGKESLPSVVESRVGKFDLERLPLLSLQVALAAELKGKMNPLNDFQCVPCEFFQKGLCLCVRRKDGPRATRDCRTCRCQIVNLILSKKVRTHKIFYHLRNQGLCKCKLICKLRKDGKQCHKKTKKGKITFTVHKTCQKFYTQCNQMEVLEKNFKELSEIYKKTNSLLIPANCTPFLGTARRNFPEVKKFESECFERRQYMAGKVKKMLNWKKPSKTNFIRENLQFCSKIDLYLNERKTHSSKAHSSVSSENSALAVAIQESSEEERALQDEGRGLVLPYMVTGHGVSANLGEWEMLEF